MDLKAPSTSHSSLVLKKSVGGLTDEILIVKSKNEKGVYAAVVGLKIALDVKLYRMAFEMLDINLLYSMT